ncbi:MAG: hypothetical protein U7127_31465 (plasmid) [Phormidium sp.]
MASVSVSRTVGKFTLQKAQITHRKKHKSKPELPYTEPTAEQVKEWQQTSEMLGLF